MVQIMGLLPPAKPINLEEKPVAFVGFWCPFHLKYDTCVLEVNCPSHPTPNIGRAYHNCICDGKAWEKHVPADPSCKCYCHKQYHTGEFSTCGYCCGSHRKLHNIDFCECICHTEFAVGHAPHGSRCCEDRKTVGETDKIARWGFESLNVWPWNAQFQTRVKSSTMQENVHLFMSVKGEPNATDLFHIILHACDSNYPIKPMRKSGDTIRICSRCKGMLWDKCSVGLREIKIAACQASEETGEALEVRVHHWMLTKSCGCYEHRTIPIKDYKPHFRGHQPMEIEPAVEPAPQTESKPEAEAASSAPTQGD